MARMLPDKVPGRVSKPVATVYSALKKIESDDIVCRLSYALDGRHRPEFFVLYKNRYVFLIAVSGATVEELESHAHGSLFQRDKLIDRLDLEARHRMDAFVGAITESIEGADAKELPVARWIIFPRAPNRIVEQITQLLGPSDYRLLGKGDCSSAQLYELMKDGHAGVVSEVLLNNLRREFSPEAVISSNWITQESRAPYKSKGFIGDFFLDIDQESAVKRDLELSEEAQSVADAGNIRLITGVAGSGKTLVLMYRARLAARLDSAAKVLVLMHNKPLSRDLKLRAKQLDPAAEIEWRTFYSWIRKYFNFRTIGDSTRYRLISDLIRKVNPRLGLSAEFIGEEFNWIQDNATEALNLSWYLEVERIGRGRGLGESHRRQVFELFIRYRERLAETNEIDWSGVPAAFLRKISSGKVKLNVYDAIYIDEAQFFAPVWFECIKHALHPDHGNLFLVADPTQGFLRSGMSWARALGREVRGRSQRLTVPYRNTRQILEFARRFYLKRIPVEDDEVNLPDSLTLERMPEGHDPVLVWTRTAQDERTLVIHEIGKAVARGLNPGHILIIHADQSTVDSLVREIDQKFPGRAVDAKDAEDREKVRVCSINACTGLEAPVVVILGAEILLQKEGSLDLDETGREELIRTNTKKIFVAITRATQRVVLCHRKARPPDCFCQDRNTETSSVQIVSGSSL